MEGVHGEQLSGYEMKKRNYFSRFAAAHLSSLRPHEEYGILGEKAKKEDWRRPSEHCLVEAVTADVIAEKLGFSEEERNNLVSGAFLHDFYKREQMRIFKEEGVGLESLEKSERASSAILKEKGFSPEVIAITEGATDTEKMALSYSDTTFSERIMFYIDSITDYNEISTIEERISISEASNRYQGINEERKKRLGGKSEFDAMREASYKIQAEIAEKIGIKDPENLPEWIREQIKNRIEKEK